VNNMHDEGAKGTTIVDGNRGDDRSTDVHEFEDISACGRREKGSDEHRRYSSRLYDVTKRPSDLCWGRVWVNGATLVGRALSTAIG
jgi:hypothetical protein